MDPKSQADLDNHANQLNPNNDAYYSSRSNDDDVDDDDKKDEREEPDWDDSEDFQEEWIPQDAW